MKCTHRLPRIDNTRISLIRLRHMHSGVYYGHLIPGISSLHHWYLLSFINYAIMVTNQSCEESLQLHISETVPNTIGASFHGCSSVTHVQSRWIVVDKSPGVASDDSEIKEGDQIEKVDGPEKIPANDDDSPPIHMTYQFDSCQVYINSFNTRGVKVKNSGNYAPRVTRLSCSLLYFSHMTDPYC